MVQHATAAVSIAGSILLCLVFIGLVYDLIAGYSARRRFAKLLSLKKVWLGGKSCATAALLRMSVAKRADHHRFGWHHGNKSGTTVVEHRHHYPIGADPGDQPVRPVPRRRGAGRRGQSKE